MSLPYIFGRGIYFELDLEEMKPADDHSSIIVRPMEDKSVLAVLSRMVKVNYAKQVLTVTPNTKTRPKCWSDCLKHGPSTIINRQHTWKAASEIVSGEVDVEDTTVKEKLKSWTCEVMWSSNKDHLHTLSAKCNDGNNVSPHLTSLPATIMHCQFMWKNAGRLKWFRKNLEDKTKEEFLHYVVSLLQPVSLYIYLLQN